MAVSKRIMKHQKVQELKAMGLTKTEVIARMEEEKVDPPSWPTLCKYYNNDYDPYRESEAETYAKERVFDQEPLKGTIIEILNRNHEKLRISSIYDVLIEKFVDSGVMKALPGNEQTLRNFVHYLKQTHQVEISSPKKRRYTLVEEMPPGKQLLIDFGEIEIEDGIRIHFICILLRYSRFLYVYVQDRRFNASDACLAIYLCFKRIGGRVEVLVIDQDSVFIYQEKYGEIIETSTFGDFIKEQELKLYVCRKADPESKGAIEKTVQFVKQNFFSARKLHTLQSVRDGINAWMKRKNQRIHQTTLKVPADEMKAEQVFLRPLVPSLYGMVHDDYQLYMVKEIQFLRYRTNKYSVPLEYCYKQVKYKVIRGYLRIYDVDTGKEIAAHAVNEQKGVTILAPEHKRKQSTAWMAQAEALKQKYRCASMQHFINGIKKENPRYVMEQLSAVKRFLDQQKKLDLDFLEQVLMVCCKEYYYRVSEFIAAFIKMNLQTAQNVESDAYTAEIPSTGVDVDQRKVGTYGAAFQQRIALQEKQS